MTFPPRLRFNITTKFAAYLLFIAVLPLSMVGVTSYISASYVIENQARNYSERIVHDQARYLDLQLRQSASLLDSLSNDDAIIDVMTLATTAENSYLNLVAQERVGANLNNYLDINGLVGILLLTQDGRFYYVGDTLTPPDIHDETKNRIINDPNLNEARIYWLGLQNNINSSSSYEQVITAVRPITRINLESGQNEILGYIIANYDPLQLEQTPNLNDSHEGLESNIIIVDSNNHIIYHSNTGLLGTTINTAFTAQLADNYGALTTIYDGQETLVSYHKSTESGWIILSLIPVNTLLQPARLIGLASLIVFGLSLSLAMGFAWLFNRDVVNPIRELTAGFKQSQEGPEKWHIRLKSQNRDEIGELIHWFNTFMESLQARAETEKALRDSEELYRLVFESVNDGLLIFDSSATAVLEVNTAVCEMFGYDEGTLLTHSPTDLFLPQEHAQFLAYLEKIKSGSQEMLTLTGRHQHGRDIALEIHGNVISFHNQHQILLVIRDITERLQAERAMRHTQKLESLGVMAGGIAHDFNNLLVAMLAQTSLAMRKLDLTHPARRHVQKAVNAADRAADLTRQMLAYSGQGHFEVTNINLNQLIQENVDLLHAALPKQIELSLALAPNLPAIRGDKGQLQQVIMNIVLNAAEAIEQEELGKVEIETYLDTIPPPTADNLRRQTHVELPATASGAHLVFAVTDNGCGMDEGTMARIFDPFFTTKFTGRGLGLAAVLGIVKGHGGTMRVNSKPSVGTRFELYFPLVQDRDTAVSALPTTAPLSHALPIDHHILIIDDETPVREVVADILSDANYHPLTAPNGQSGLNLLAQTPDVKLIILDYSMPGLNGLETLKRIRENHPYLPVILSSGYAQPADLSAMAQDEHVSFLMKPYTPIQLLTAVSEAMTTTSATSA